MTMLCPQGGGGSLHAVSGPGPGGDHGAAGEAGGLAPGLCQGPGTEAGHLAAMMVTSDWFMKLEGKDAEGFKGVA